ncbi:MAG: tetratricopeptide repeat protein, partial [Vicinamibacteria bacterium]
MNPLPTVPPGQDRRRLFDQELIASLASGNIENAREEARRVVNEGSLRLVPRAFLALAGEESLSEFARKSKHYLGEDEFAFLEASIAFADSGQVEDAWRILDAGKEDSWLLSRYHLAYWSHILGRERESRAILNETATLSSDFVFPSRPESIEALRFAARETNDFKPYLLLGNLFAGLGRIEDAAELWREAARRDPGSSVAHRNLAMVAWKRSNTLEEAAQHMRLAIEARPSDQTLYRDLARIHGERGRKKDAVQILESIPLEGRLRPDVTLELARAYVAEERYDDAIQLLSKTTFSNWEGDSGTHRLYS